MHECDKIHQQTTCSELLKCTINPEQTKPVVNPLFGGKVENFYTLKLTALIMLSANPHLTLGSTITWEF